MPLCLDNRRPATKLISQRERPSSEKIVSVRFQSPRYFLFYFTQLFKFGPLSWVHRRSGGQVGFYVCLFLAACV